MWLFAVRKLFRSSKLKLLILAWDYRLMITGFNVEHDELSHGWWLPHAFCIFIFKILELVWMTADGLSSWLGCILCLKAQKMRKSSFKDCMINKCSWFSSKVLTTREDNGWGIDTERTYWTAQKFSHFLDSSLGLLVVDTLLCFPLIYGSFWCFLESLCLFTELSQQKGYFFFVKI